MACGIAVKRSLELDPHHSPETVKRPKLAQGMRTSPPLTCAGTSAICSPFTSSTTITSGSGSDSDGGMEDHPTVMHMGQQQHQEQQQLFTMQQVELICSRLLKEREDQLRAEYEHTLFAKLQEQYDSFSKFAQDQIYRCAQESTGHAASYLS